MGSLGKIIGKFLSILGASLNLFASWFQPILADLVAMVRISLADVNHRSFLRLFVSVIQTSEVLYVGPFKYKIIFGLWNSCFSPLIILDLLDYIRAQLKIGIALSIYIAKKCSVRITGMFYQCNCFYCSLCHYIGLRVVRACSYTMEPTGL